MMARKIIDLTGQRFDRLSVEDFAGFNRETQPRSALWNCRCDCGGIAVITTNHLRMGTTRSCGCLNTETRAGLCRSRSTHGHSRRLSRSPTYDAWANMHNRCRPDSVDAGNYFNRGVTVCERWESFENFLVDMGERPSKGMWLDRIDGSRGYEPGNCRWASIKVQQNNRRNNRYLVIRGERMTMAEAAERFGMNYNTLRSRIYLLGQDAETAVGLAA